MLYDENYKFTYCFKQNKHKFTQTRTQWMQKIGFKPFQTFKAQKTAEIINISFF